MKTRLWCILSLGSLAVACGSVHEVKDRSHAGHAKSMVRVEDEDGDDEAEEAVPLDQVPEAVKKAALAAVPGLVLESAEKETENGVLVYCLEGQDGGERVEVEIRASDAHVTEIERGEDDDD